MSPLCRLKVLLRRLRDARMKVAILEEAVVAMRRIVARIEKDGSE